MRLLTGVAIVILALSPLAFAAARGRRRRSQGQSRSTGLLVLEGLIVLAAAVLGVVVAVALLER